MITRRSFVYHLALILLCIPAAAQDTWQKEGSELAAILHWRSGDTTAEIGAGKGKLTSIAAEHVGMSGRVYSTELDPDSLAALRNLAETQPNITLVQASDSDTKLPDGSCDSIFMRLVYHHFTKPEDIDSRLFRALKHHGRLAVIDEEPGKGTTIPQGVPANRLGHGIPQKVLIGELKYAGFKVQHIENNWPGGDAYHKMYCVVFLKP